MRISLVTETFFPAVDATTTTVKAVADRLIDTGHQVQVVAPGPGLASYRGCPVARIRPLDRRGAQVREALTTFRPDLVHVTSPRGVGRRALEHASRAGVATLVVEQSADLREHPLADTTLVTARWMADRVRATGADAQLWTPGVDTTAFTPALRDAWLHGRWSRARSLARPLVVVGYVGSLRRRHDVRRLADLAAVPGIRLVVAGEGPQRDWLRGRLPDAKLLGPLSTGELSVVLPTFDLLLHPGTAETCCHPLREAGAAGVPVVAPRRGGAREVVRHLETGLLYDPDDRHGLVHAVAALAADPHRALLGARAREVAARTWTEAVDELVEHHYGALLGRPALGGNRA